MTKQMVPGKERIQKIYWILVAITCALLVSVHPVMAETIFDRFSTIMQDIYGQLVAISRRLKINGFCLFWRLSPCWSE